LRREVPVGRAIVRVVITDRRGFLRLAGLGAVVGAAAACTTPGTPGPVPGGGSSTATPPPTTARPSGPPDWAGLRSKLAGELVLPGDGGYDAARAPFNALYADRRPAAVARCASPSDVQACVETARNSGIAIAARSGGHSYAGYSTPENGLVVDLSRMSGVDVKADGTAVVQSGTRLIDVYTALAAQGRALPAGSCPTVGIAGLTLGGGQGVLTRLHGLTCDKLRSADVVLADSTAAPADGELLWSLRGGGGGNLAIVTAFTFDTVPAPDTTVFALRFPAGSVPAVLGAWQEWIAAAPDELWSNCVISAGSPPGCRVGGCFVGPGSALNPLVDDLVKRAGVAPSSRAVTGKGYLDAMRYFAGCSTKSVDQCRAAALTAFVGSSRMLEAPLRDPGAVAALVDGRTGIDLLFDSLGGAVGRVAPDATAYPHRGAIATIQVYASGSDRGPTAEVQSGLAAIAGHGAYVNYIDPGQADWAQAYYGANLARLRAAAKRYDPDGVFRFAQGLTA
jgi:FAD binding domain/Berberine and berberine like